MQKEYHRIYLKRLFPDIHSNSFRRKVKALKKKKRAPPPVLELNVLFKKGFVAQAEPTY